MNRNLSYLIIQSLLQCQPVSIVYMLSFLVKHVNKSKQTYLSDYSKTSELYPGISKITTNMFNTLDNKSEIGILAKAKNKAITNPETLVALI